MDRRAPLWFGCAWSQGNHEPQRDCPVDPLSLECLQDQGDQESLSDLPKNNDKSTDIGKRELFSQFPGRQSKRSPQDDHESNLLKNKRVILLSRRDPYLTLKPRLPLGSTVTLGSFSNLSW
ncbi:hypothetical protein L345_01276, partial [Ophiophagus hannah]